MLSQRLTLYATPVIYLTMDRLRELSFDAGRGVLPLAMCALGSVKRAPRSRRRHRLAPAQLRTTEVTRLRALLPSYSELLTQVDSSFAVAVRLR